MKRFSCQHRVLATLCTRQYGCHQAAQGFSISACSLGCGLVLLPGTNKKVKRRHRREKCPRRLSKMLNVWWNRDSSSRGGMLDYLISRRTISDWLRLSDCPTAPRRANIKTKVDAEPPPGSRAFCTNYERMLLHTAAGSCSPSGSRTESRGNLGRKRQSNTRRE